MQKLTYSAGYKKLIDLFIESRIKCDLVQEDIAKLLKIQQCDVSKIESLERELSIAEFIVLLDFFKLNYDEVVDIKLFLKFLEDKQT